MALILQQTQDNAAASSMAICNQADQVAGAYGFTADANYTLTAVELICRGVPTTGTTIPNLTGYIHAESGGAVGSVLGTATTVRNGLYEAEGVGSDFIANYMPVRWEGFNLALTSGTKYYFVLSGDDSGATKYLTTLEDAHGAGWSGQVRRGTYPQLATSYADANTQMSMYVGSETLTLAERSYGFLFQGSLNDHSSRKYYASCWDAGATYNLGQIGVAAYAVGSPTGNMTLELWSGASTTPVAVLDTADNTYDVSKLGSIPTWMYFQLGPVAITSGTRYWVVLYTDAAVDASNYIKIFLRDTFIPYFSEASSRSSDKSTFVALDNSGFAYELYESAFTGSIYHILNS